MSVLATPSNSARVPASPSNTNISTTIIFNLGQNEQTKKVARGLRHT